MTRYANAIAAIDADQRIEDPEVLALADEYGYTVTHYAAGGSQRFEDPKILAWANIAGWTVAHSAAWGGQQFEDSESWYGF